MAPIVEIAVQILAVLGVLGVAYLMLVRPQLKRLEAHRRLLESLSLGDRIVTRGGLIGEIVGIEGSEVIELRLSESVTVRALRDSVDERLGLDGSGSGDGIRN